MQEDGKGLRKQKTVKRNAVTICILLSTKAGRRASERARNSAGAVIQSFKQRESSGGEQRKEDIQSVERIGRHRLAGGGAEATVSSPVGLRSDGISLFLLQVSYFGRAALPHVHMNSGARRS